MPGSDAIRKDPLVVAVVGIDGCGKSSAFREALDRLARRSTVVGIGDELLAGAPGSAVRERRGPPLARVTVAIGRVAKRTRPPWAYKQLKMLDLMGRARLRDDVVDREASAVVLTDGDPLVNSVAWSIGRLYRAQLQDDDRIVDVMHYLAGERDIPWSELSGYLRQAPQLVAMNRLGIARFRFPDLVIHLHIDGATAMERIRERGRPLQPHETAAALDALEGGYRQACRLLETRCGVEVIRIPCAQWSRDEVAAMVERAVSERLSRPAPPSSAGQPAEAVDVVATTMSGSLRDQRKVGRIGPVFRAATDRIVRVRTADSHVEARERAREAVVAGGRIIVSAGGAGTFNAVLEGCHIDGVVPSDLRLAFLRKGSADLIGKMLRVPDDLDAAVSAIVDGIEKDRRVDADVLAVEVTRADEGVERHHLVGFGGLGVFGEVPRFTESRVIKLYKGILSTLFGDYGPFYVGLGLASAWWYLRLRRGRVPAMTLELDDDTVGPATWTSIIIVNGDLGPAFPLGRGLAYGSGTLRVVALRYDGLRAALRQLAAARSGRLLERPDRYAAVVREVRSFTATPQAARQDTLVNIDGLRRSGRGPLRFTVDGRVRLVAGPATAS